MGAEALGVEAPESAHTDAAKFLSVRVDSAGLDAEPPCGLLDGQVPARARVRCCGGGHLLSLVVTSSLSARFQVALERPRRRVTGMSPASSRVARQRPTVSAPTR